MFTSARQFSKFVSFSGSSSSRRATYRSVSLSSAPFMWTSTPWSRASIRCCWIFLYFSLSSVLTLATSSKISSKFFPISGSGYAMIVKLRSSGFIYSLAILLDSFWYSTESFSCFSERRSPVSLFSGVNGSSPNVSIHAGPANKAASSFNFSYAFR